MVSVPLEPPETIPARYDERLFDLCRNDDYRGLYRELVRRAAGLPKPRRKRGFIGIAYG